MYNTQPQNFGLKNLGKISKSKLGDPPVKGDLKAPFSIATTPRCREGHYSFPWIAQIYPWSIPYNAECQARRRRVPFFWVFDMTRHGIEPQSPGPLANTLTARNYCIDDTKQVLFHPNVRTTKLKGILNTSTNPKRDILFFATTICIELTSNFGFPKAFFFCKNSYIGTS